MRQYKYLDFITGMFVAVLLISNLLSSAKIIHIGIDVFGVPLAIDAGTLIFPIAYIFGDILTEIYGYERARRVIWIGFLANILMGFFVYIAGILPGDPSWEGYAGQGAYNAILGGVTGLIVASLAAYWFGAFSNSYVLAKLKVLTNGRFVPLRTIGSTLIGQLLDTVVFIAVATMLGVFAGNLFVSLFITNYILKVSIEVVMTPITLWIVSGLKWSEGIDVYDTETHFNPFALGTRSAVQS